MPPEFNPSYHAPNWAWWIAIYFFVGGLAGGSYFTAAWLDLFGDAADRPAVRLGHLLALPLVLLGSLLLIVDLGQPLRFWHMIFQSERFPLPMLKPYSPMSLGSVILAVFGGVAFLSFADAALGHRLLHRPGNPAGKVLSAVGAVGGLALAGYTGALVNVSNEPVWDSSPLVTALFLFSGVSTGMALLLLLGRRAPSTTEKLQEADGYLMGLELLALLAFLATLGAVGARFILGRPTTLVLFVVVVVVGLLVPLLLHWQPAIAGGARRARPAAAVLAILGGFVLRWAVLAGPQGAGL